MSNIRGKMQQVRQGAGYDAHKISSRLSSQKKAVSKSLCEESHIVQTRAARCVQLLQTIYK